MSDIVFHTLLIWFRLDHVNFNICMHNIGTVHDVISPTISGQQIEMILQLLIHTSKLWATSDF